MEVRSNSHVVVGHIQGVFDAQGDKTIKYLSKVQECQSYFDRVVLAKIPRKDNTELMHWCDWDPEQTTKFKPRHKKYEL